MLNRLAGYLKRIESGVILNVLIHFATSFGLGFASFFLGSQGVPLFKIMLMWAVSPLAAAIVAFSFNRWHLKRQLIFGTLSYTFMALSLLFFNDYSYLLYGIFSGFTMGFYWVSLNYVFFGKSEKQEHAKDFNVYFLIGPIFGIILPPLGAFVINSFGFQVLFSITGLFSLIPLIYVYKDGFNQVLESSFREANDRFSGLRLYMALNDALHFFQGHFIAVYILLFLSTEYEIGGVISYLALISLAVTFFVSDVSDRTQKRMKFLMPLLIGMGILIISMIFIKSPLLFIIATGAYAILDNMSLPIRYAIPMDVRVKDIGFWRAAEVYGNIGRFIAFGFSALFLYLGNYWVPLLIFALISFAIPYVVRSRVGVLD